MATKRGIGCKLYIDMSVAGDGSDFRELKGVSDWTQNFGYGRASFTTRGPGYEQHVKTAPSLSWSGKLKHDPDDEVYEKALDLVHSPTASVLVLALTGAKNENGATGYQCLCQFYKADQAQGTQDVVMDDIEIYPYPPTEGTAATYLRRVVVASGAPTYTIVVPSDIDGDGTIESGVEGG